MMTGMKFRHELEYDAPSDEVYAMLVDPAFREEVCKAQDAHSSDVTVKPTGTGMSVVVDQKRPADGIPSFAKKFVGEEIQVLQKEEWTNRSGAALHVSIPGKPGEMKGTISLDAKGTGTVEIVEGDIKVSIPLVAGKLEKMIGDLLASALKAERRVGTKWLAGQR